MQRPTITSENLNSPFIIPCYDEETPVDKEAEAVASDIQPSPDEWSETGTEEEEDPEKAKAEAIQLAMNFLHAFLAVASVFLITLAATATEPPKYKPQIISISCLPFCWAALYYCNDTIKTATIPCTKKQPLAAILSPLLVGSINYTISCNTDQGDSNVSNRTNWIYALIALSIAAYLANCNRPQASYDWESINSIYRYSSFSNTNIRQSYQSNHSSA